MADKKITELQLRSNVSDDLNFPSDDGIQSYRVTGAQIFAYIRSLIPAASYERENIQINASVASSALTIALKTQAGNNASTTDKMRVGFRSSTLSSGAFNIREITAALSMVVSSGSTLGQTNAVKALIYVYLIDNAGTPELAVSAHKFNETDLVSTTAEGGAGAADSGSVMYSTTARTSVPCRLIGYLVNTQTTAGTWATAPSQIQLAPVDKSAVPPGAIMPFGGSTVPDGYMFCDGSAVSRASFADLFAAIGTTHGVGDGSTTFNIPNTQSMFIRGAGAQTVGGIGYTGYTLGDKNTDTLQGHRHRLTTTNGAGGGTGGVDLPASRTINTNDGIVTTIVTDGTNGTPRVSTETKPANIVLNHIIKY